MGVNNAIKQATLIFSVYHLLLTQSRLLLVLLHINALVWFGCFGLIWLHVELKGLLNGPRGLESVLCRGGSECQLRPVRVEGVLEQVCVVVVYHVPIVTIGHGLLKKFWPLILGCVLCTSLELLNYYLTLAIRSGRVRISV